MREHLPEKSDDDQVFDLVRTRHGVLVSRDQKILRRPHQVQSLLDAKIGAFFLTGRGQKDERQMAIFLLDRLPEIQDLAQRARVPYAYNVPDRGDIEPMHMRRG